MLSQLNTDIQEYQLEIDLNIYDSPECVRLATQAAKGRFLRLISSSSPSFHQSLFVELCEDDYPGWLTVSDSESLKIASTSYQAKTVSFPEIQQKLPEVINFTQEAMKQPNEYLWGGTIGPNYDCSGLIQAAFQSVGIWLPRDAYQQESFTDSIPLSDAQPGDLIFFSTSEKVTHVGLYLGEGYYIHSSGKDQGRNGIGIDRLSSEGDIISQCYFRQLHGVGRVSTSYQPKKNRL